MSNYGLNDRIDENRQVWRNYWQSLTERLELENIGTILGIFAVAILAVGYLHEHHGFLAGLPLFDRLSESLYTNLSSQLISIMIIVLILNHLNKIQETHNQQMIRQEFERKELIRLKALLTTQEFLITKIALAELKLRGWLNDGSLRDLELYEANWEGVYIPFVDLGHTTLENVNFQRANLFHVNFLEAGINDSNFEGAYLHVANLENVYAAGANLSHCDLQGANLCGADMDEANLCGANLRRAKLEHANMHRVVCDENTILPDGRKWRDNVDWSQFGAVSIADSNAWLAYLYKAGFSLKVHFGDEESANLYIQKHRLNSDTND